MKVAHLASGLTSLWTALTRSLAGLFVALLLGWVCAPAYAAPPPAGTSISNQASATYSDGSGVARTVSSNLVQTTVTQVYSLLLAASGSQNATPGSVVYYPHTVTNTGNGSDTFNLGASSASGFAMGTVQIFADNGSGQPTGAAITSSGPLASGAAFKFIVTGTVPTGAVPPATNTITVSATSVGDATKTGANTDTTTVTSNAVVTLTKSISAAAGTRGSGPYTYTLTYTNTGNSDATAVAISDAIPVGMTYQANSARWSVTGATVLSDSGASVGTAPNTLTSSYTSGTHTLLATVAKVAPGQSGFITFAVMVDAGVAPGVLNNTATSSYYNGAATVPGSSNTVPFTVTQTAGVTLTGATVAGPAAPGTSVSFTNVVSNGGNGTDTFNITLVAGNNFPSGTTFQLYKSDGTTPLVDTNGDGKVDTGPLAAGTTYNVILKATLPPNAGGTGPFTIDKTATSALDATKTSTGTDSLTAITAAKVDLSNDTSGGPGTGVGPEGAAVAFKQVNPGTTAVFTLVTTNAGLSPDSYDLAASTDQSFGALTLPAGWSVVFKAGDATCSTTGATITNTGNVAGNGGSGNVCAVVTVPAGFAAGSTELFFRALSPTSGAIDRLHDQVVVNAVRAISITPNGTGQTYPGGSYVYSHTLTNNGNVTEGGAFSTLTPALVNGGAGWTSTLYFDLNGDGALDAGDTLVTGSLNGVLGAGLAKGQSITLFDKVIAPSGAVPGTINVTTITVSTVNGSYITAAPAAAVTTDSTAVIAGNLTLVKLQALDADCNGTADTPPYGQGNLSAKPGQCVLYQITVTNVGAADATNVVVSDATPSYTTVSTVAATALPGFVSGPTVGNAGTITANIGTGATAGAGGTLAAGQSAVITFGVKITP